MGWKDWSFWIKGGIIGVLFGILPTIVYILPLEYYLKLGFTISLSQNFPDPFMFISPFLFNSSICKNLPVIFFIATVEILTDFFLTGAFVAWIIKKRKYSDKKWIYTLILVILSLAILGYLFNNVEYSKMSSTPSTEEFQNNQYVQEEKILVKNGGACVTKDSQNFGNNCIFTTKENCNAEFYQGILCTAEQLKTVCAPAQKSITLEGREYFMDSCGNQANLYDSSQYNDGDYWTNSIE